MPKKEALGGSSDGAAGYGECVQPKPGSSGSQTTDHSRAKVIEAIEYYRYVNQYVNDGDTCSNLTTINV